MELREALQQRIQQLCKEHHLTLCGLSALCGIHPSTLSNTMSGRNQSVTVSTIQKICDGLDMDLPQFFDSDLFRNFGQGKEDT